MKHHRNITHDHPHDTRLTWQPVPKKRHTIAPPSGHGADCWGRNSTHKAISQARAHGHHVAGRRTSSSTSHTIRGTDDTRVGGCQAEACQWLASGHDSDCQRNITPSNHHHGTDGADRSNHEIHVMGLMAITWLADLVANISIVAASSRHHTQSSPRHRW
jgi:hypothetical protein